jgi:riboflavin kinase/FMN adenylyltransferase
VATIGKFDGVHLGHKQILAQLTSQAKERHLPSLVILFEPHPAEFFIPDKAPVRLNSLTAKLKYLAEQKIDRVLCLKFNAALASMTADQFIDDILVGKLAVAHFVVGDDFRFGKGRSGTFEQLQQQGAKLGFSVENTISYKLEGTRVSSTEIRRALADNDFARVKLLSDRAFSMIGRVMHGQALGRTIGVPTANVKTTRYKLPLTGVYAVIATLENGQRFQAVANLGVRPTVDGSKSVLEVHLFDFSDTIYGQKLSVEFQKFIRKEKKFADFDQLKQAIFNDIDVVKKYFATSPVMGMEKTNE